jgi:hypothetical protein
MSVCCSSNSIRPGKEDTGSKPAIVKTPGKSKLPMLLYLLHNVSIVNAFENKS